MEKWYPGYHLRFSRSNQSAGGPARACAPAVPAGGGPAEAPALLRTLRVGAPPGRGSLSGRRPARLRAPTAHVRTGVPLAFIRRRLAQAPKEKRFSRSRVLDAVTNTSRHSKTSSSKASKKPPSSSACLGLQEKLLPRAWAGGRADRRGSTSVCIPFVSQDLAERCSTLACVVVSWANGLHALCTPFLTRISDKKQDTKEDKRETPRTAVRCHRAMAGPQACGAPPRPPRAQPPATCRTTREATEATSKRASGGEALGAAGRRSP